MADTISKEQRSKNMSAIRNKDTKPEIYLRKRLFALGLRYRKNATYIFGCPDIFIPKYKTAIFVNGCYWHRHNGCKYAYHPKSNIVFWEAKFSKNVNRDAVVREHLLSQQIKCLVVWECTVKRMKRATEFETNTIEQILSFLKSDKLYMEL